MDNGVEAEFSRRWSPLSFWPLMRSSQQSTLEYCIYWRSMLKRRHKTSAFVRRETKSQFFFFSGEGRRWQDAPRRSSSGRLLLLEPANAWEEWRHEHLRKKKLSSCLDLFVGSLKLSGWVLSVWQKHKSRWHFFFFFLSPQIDCSSDTMRINIESAQIALFKQK